MTFNATLAADDGTLPTEVQGRLMNEAIFIIDTGGQGMTIKETWDAMGMRATGTHTVVFDEMEMPQEALLGFFRMALFGQLEWPALTFAAVYHGLALKAYEEARQVLRTKSLGMTPLGAETHLRDLGYVQLGLGEIVMKNETTARVLESTCVACWKVGTASGTRRPASPCSRSPRSSRPRTPSRSSMPAWT